MMQRTLGRLLPAFVLLFALTGCSYLDGAPVESTQLRIVNATDTAITSASARFCDWSEESDYRPLILQGFEQQLEAGASREMSFSAGCFDLRAILSDGTVIEVPNEQISVGTHTWRVTR